MSAGPQDRHARLVSEPDDSTRLCLLSGSTADEVSDPFFAGGLLLPPATALWAGEGAGGAAPWPRPRLLQQGDSDVCLLLAGKGAFLTHDR